jgi:glyoxylase-like metal-dependent hydrolase (beta-lactamase superfamily II)
MEIVQSITPNLKLLDFCPPSTLFEHFICSYLLHGKKKALVDVGPSVIIPDLLSAISTAGFSPDEIDYIILTHIHMDHAGGIGQAVHGMKNARVIVHSHAVKHLIDPSKLWQASRATLGDLALKYGEIEPVPADRIIAAEDGMKIDLGDGLTPEIYLTPGHAPHHLAVFDRKDSILLSGDMAGMDMNGFLRPGTAPPFRLNEYLASLDRMIALQPEKIGYAHFGVYGGAVARLRSLRQQTIDWFEIVQTAAKAGLSADEIMPLLLAKDRNVDKLNAENPTIYHREYSMIKNTVIGMMTAK